MSKSTESKSLPGKLTALVLSAMLLSACNTVATRDEAEPSSDPHASLESAESRILPNAELSPELLYYILVGEVAGQRGELAIAVQALLKAAEQTRDPRLAERATQAAIYARQFKEGSQAGQLWTEIEPDNQTAHESLATTLLELDQPARAQLHLEQALQLADQKNLLGTVFLRIGGMLSRQKNRDAAMEVMQNLTVVYPKNPYAWLALAHLSVRADNLATASQAASSALKHKPGWEDAALYKGRILIGQNELDKAEQFYRSFLDDNPGASNVRLNYARFLVDRKQWERASKEFKRVIKSTPNDADAILAVGVLSVQAERLDDARKYLERHLELKPDSDQARLYLGQVADKRHDYETAIRWYEDISDPRFYLDAQTRAAISIARHGNLDTARDRLHKLVPENDTQRSQIVLTEEQILREARQFGEALKVLTAALKESPDDTEIRYARALIAEKLDNLDMVEGDLRYILKKDPDNVHALNALGYTLADRTDRHQEALVLLKKALLFKPDDAFVLDSMGWVQYRLGNYQEAVQYLKRALAIRNDAEISAHLGEVLWIIGERKEAEHVWHRALKLTPDNESLQGVIRKFKQ
ncbi:MAG: tetratricopeptide repeat protein [Gammaproteobacteria bacterium]|nr:tetratricopeptide repeat protein [Gammaproteobacteria bacterium]